MAWGLGVLGIGTCLALAYQFDVLSVVSPTPVAASAFVSTPLAAAPVQPIVLPPDPIFLEVPAAAAAGDVQLVAGEAPAPVAVAETWVAPVAAPVAGLPAPATPAPARVTAAVAAPAPAAWPAPRAKKPAKPQAAAQALALVPNAAPAPNELTIDDSNQPAPLAPVLVADAVAAPTTPTTVAPTRPATAPVAVPTPTPTVLKTVPVYAVPVATTKPAPVATAVPTTAPATTSAPTAPPKVTTTTTLVPLPKISAPIVNKSIAAVQTPTRVDVGNAGSVVFSLNSNSTMSLVAALPAPGVVALVTSNTSTKLSVKFFSPGVAGSASFNATLVGSTFTYQTGA
jgi:hypothetical protein